MVPPFTRVLRNLHIVSLMVVLIHILTSSVSEFFFRTTEICVFVYSHFNLGEVMSHGFDSHSPG